LIQALALEVIFKDLIDKMPKVLIIHLNTYYFDHKTGVTKKINYAIDFNEDLTLSSSYLSNEANSINSHLSFELISVICHKGQKANEGHYISFCKDDKQSWWSLNDAKILQIDKKNIFKFRPYLLFYQYRNLN